MFFECDLIIIQTVPVALCRSGAVSCFITWSSYVFYRTTWNTFLKTTRLTTLPLVTRYVAVLGYTHYQPRFKSKTSLTIRWNKYRNKPVALWIFLSLRVDRIIPEITKKHKIIILAYIYYILKYSSFVRTFVYLYKLKPIKSFLRCENWNATFGKRLRLLHSTNAMESLFGQLENFITFGLLKLSKSFILQLRFSLIKL